MGFGSGRYKITGGVNDGREFYASDLLGIRNKGWWSSARIEHGTGSWLFFWSDDEKDVLDDLMGLPVRLTK